MPATVLLGLHNMLSLYLQVCKPIFPSSCGCVCSIHMLQSLPWLMANFSFYRRNTQFLSSVIYQPIKSSSTFQPITDISDFISVASSLAESTFLVHTTEQAPLSLCRVLLVHLLRSVCFLISFYYTTYMLK